MSDQPKWMPSETELDDLVGRIEDAYDGPNTSSLACSILAGAIRAAVEKALIEQDVLAHNARRIKEETEP